MATVLVGVARLAAIVVVATLSKRSQLCPAENPASRVTLLAGIKEYPLLGRRAATTNGGLTRRSEAPPPPFPSCATPTENINTYVRARYLDVTSTEAAARRGGLGERVALPAFVACLLLHSDEVALSLLEKAAVDGYADRLVILVKIERGTTSAEISRAFYHTQSNTAKLTVNQRCQNESFHDEGWDRHLIRPCAHRQPAARHPPGVL